MDVTNDCYWCLLVRCVDHDLVSSCYGKDHSVGEVEKRDRARVDCLLEEVWIESYACGVCLEAWKHKGRLAQSVLQETIDCVCVAAA